MKSKNIPADIKLKSIKEAQNEVKEILLELEKNDANLEDSIEDYTRMMHLNNHIQEQYKKKMKEINKSKLKKADNSTSKE